MPASTRGRLVHASTTGGADHVRMIRASPTHDPRGHGHRKAVADPDKHETREELSSFNPTGGPRRSKFGPLLLTLAVLLLVFLSFAAVGCLGYNTG